MGEYWSDNGGDAAKPTLIAGFEPTEVEIVHLDYWQMVACTLGGFVLGAVVMYKILGGIPL